MAKINLNGNIIEGTEIKFENGNITVDDLPYPPANCKPIVGYKDYPLIVLEGRVLFDDVVDDVVMTVKD